jgi:hypothetical protein
MNILNQSLLNWYFENNGDAILVCNNPAKLDEDDYIQCTFEEAKKVMDLYSQIFLIVESARKRKENGKNN